MKYRSFFFVLVLSLLLILTFAESVEASVSYRYVKWEVTKRKSATDNCASTYCIQAAEFVLIYSNASVSWPSGTTAANPNGKNPVTETPAKAIDSSTSTKWLDQNFTLGVASQTGHSNLSIDTGASNTVTFDAYKWATANDATERDPVSWNVYGSNDNSTWTLLDNRSGESITATRNTYTSNYSLLAVSIDSVLPYFTGIPSNSSINYNSYWSGITFNASDETNISSFAVNDTRFTINSSGFLNSSLILGVGSYNINVTINDTSNNKNSTIYLLNVTQIASLVNLTLNSSQSNLSIMEATTLSLNGSLISGDLGARLLIYNNGTIINNGTLNVSNSTQFNSTGLINITFIYESSQNYSFSSLTYYLNVSAYPDSDGDGVKDNTDTLYGNESNIIYSGISSINITVGGLATNGSFSGLKEIDIMNSSTLIINFSHNFSLSGLNLSKINLTVNTNSVFINLSGQLQGNKTIYILDNSFASLCVKDDHVYSENDISSSCSGSNETSLNGCIGNSTGFTNNSILCYDQGTVIKIENLRYSGVKGTQAISESNPGSSSSSGGGGSASGGGITFPVCKVGWECSSWSFCSTDLLQNRICKRDSFNCEPGKKPEETRLCPDILFDSIIEIEDSEIYSWNDLKFRVNLIEVNNSEKVDVEIEYKILKEGLIVYENKETRAVEGTLEYDKVLKSLSLESGVYSLSVVVNYGKNQRASAQSQFIVKGFKADWSIIIILIMVIILLIIGYNLYKTKKEEENIKNYLKKVEEELVSKNENKQFYDRHTEGEVSKERSTNSIPKDKYYDSDIDHEIYSDNNNNNKGDNSSINS
ncbi:MAG: hypothetical protein Q7R87_02375 [Nanoarchaeota archaeon]|nr:hypothetical protein [Nanoarchaeota archaeon]